MVSTRNERFNRRMRPISDIYPDPERGGGTSDGGLALERMLDDIDRMPGEFSSPAERGRVNAAMVLMWAILLDAAGYGRLVPTLRLIAQNGSNRRASIRALRRRLGCTFDTARKTYFRHRCSLAAMFIWANKDGAFLALE